tara:strand:+ start:5181 stop:5591 length:411 start_codon:yes stop_codon:yes gene_type:complete
MATYNKFNQTVEDMAHGVYNCATDQFTVALTVAAPIATNTVLANLTEIAYTNLSARDLTTSTSAQTSGTFTQLFADLVLTASGGPVAAFRYITIYDNTPTSPADPLLCFYDFGSSLVLADGETLTIDFTTSTFTLA